MSTKSFLAQMPKVSFKGDDLSAYHDYTGPTPPAIEQHKYELSLDAKRAADNENYLKAAQIKHELATICRQQGKERDAHLLEVSAYELLQKGAKKLGPLDELSAYIKNIEATHPLIEQYKFELSLNAQTETESGNFSEAAKLKQTLATICRQQGKESDAHLLEVTAHELLQKAANILKRAI